MARRACAQVGFARSSVPTCSPVLFSLAPRTLRYCSTTPVVSADLTHVPPPNPVHPIPISTKTHKIVEKIKEEYHRFVNGSKLLGQNTKTAALLVRGMINGQTLNRRERQLMITTVADLIRMVPFVVILIIPFAEFALPVLLKFFPNMLPSTFASESQKEASRARKLQAKLKVIELLQAASENLVLRGKLDSNDAHESLLSFMTKISRSEEIKVQEVIKISQIFNKEFSLDSLNKSQLVSLAKFFGLPSLGNAFILQESLKFKWNLISKDDGHIMKDGIDSLSPAELQEVAVSRGFSHANPYQDQKQYVQEWITLSKENVPPYLLLLSRAQYFTKNTKKVIDITPPVIAPYIPQCQMPQTTMATTVSNTESCDLPEKELVPLEFKNLSHELSYNPVLSKLWDRIARFTSDLKKETFGGRQDEIIHMGDASADALSTVITAELRRYLQAMFIALDKDGDRKISVYEVEHGLNASDIPIQHEEAVSLVRMHDSDGDRQLSFDEFVDCLLYMRKNNRN